ncbi:SdrD B-like domain-containing protein [Streptomyces sp. NPDC004787]|uniref:SdrD B-like domain-containing protein n=1 Tax=Streptomyces sp. NPDC004787 TaxID=3154291 RepID=UPI0033AD4274
MTSFGRLGHRRHARNAALAAVGGALATALWCWPPTVAYADATSSYGEWTMNGTTGEVGIPLAGFPTAAVTTDSSTTTVQSGSSAFLGPGTPVGARYGTSQGKSYVNLRTAAGRTPSTTTLTFESPTNAGTFAFTLGDIDADGVQVSATGADGQPLTAEELGWQGAFNYCQSSPKPSSCGPTGTDTDQPVWDPSTSTLSGNGADTAGAAGWFQPTVPVTSLTLTFSMQTGFPVYQLWTSSLSSQIAGGLTSDCGTPTGQEVRLLDENGAPVLTPDGTPVTTTTDDQGHYSFVDIAPGHYQVTTTSPDYTPPTTSLAADTSDGDSVTDADMTLTCRVVPSPSPTDTAVPTPTDTESTPPTPTSTPTDSPTPTPTPTPTDPTTPAPLPTISGRPTPTLPGFPTPPATVSPEPTPTYTPAPSGTCAPASVPAYGETPEPPHCPA